MKDDSYPQYQRRCFRHGAFLTESFAHDFQPRYEWFIDWEEIRKTGFDVDRAYSLSAINSLAETVGRKMYIRDICVRCGMTVERVKEPVQDFSCRVEEKTE